MLKVDNQSFLSNISLAVIKSYSLTPESYEPSKVTLAVK